VALMAQRAGPVRYGNENSTPPRNWSPTAPTTLRRRVQYNAALICGHPPAAPIVGIGKLQIRRMPCTGFG
jgi:hypothetical protein